MQAFDRLLFPPFLLVSQLALHILSIMMRVCDNNSMLWSYYAEFQNGIQQEMISISVFINMRLSALLTKISL